MVSIPKGKAERIGKHTPQKADATFTPTCARPMYTHLLHTATCFMDG